MLVGLLSGKIERHLTRPGREIEDLLTAVVLGSCQYVPGAAAILPFLGRAVDVNGTSLSARLADVSEVAFDDYEFWPRWSKGAEPTPDNAADALQNDELADPSARGWNEPELVLRLQRRDGRKAWILVEAKLLSGKSSEASDNGAVTDQLGRYWVDFARRARAADADPLGVVYLTTGLRRTDREFAETQEELRRKGELPAPLYWLSWREFIGAADGENHPILRDVCRLLREHWALVPIAPMEPWPDGSSSALSRWVFTPSWAWPQTRRRARPIFTEDWSWPVPMTHRGDWHFDEGTT